MSDRKGKKPEGEDYDQAFKEREEQKVKDAFAKKKAKEERQARLKGYWK